MYCKQNNPSGGPYYYKSWNSYQTPFQPKSVISIEVAKGLPAYYEAFFNDKGRILKFTKYLNGQIEFVATYNYQANGNLESGEIVKQNGEKTIQKFDENGKLLK
jgi:hypothetical protein